MPDEIRIEGLRRVVAGMSIFWRQRIVDSEFRILGAETMRMCRAELEDVRYTGKLERSFVAEIDSAAKTLYVYPTAKHRMFVRMGTRPHWAPSAPIRAWATWKLGDESATWPVLRSIAQHGTSVYQQKRRGTKANPWPVRVVARGDFKTAVERTARNIAEGLSVHAFGVE